MFSSLNLPNSSTFIQLLNEENLRPDAWTGYVYGYVLYLLTHYQGQWRRKYTHFISHKFFLLQTRYIQNNKAINCISFFILLNVRKERCYWLEKHNRKIGETNFKCFGESVTCLCTRGWFYFQIFVVNVAIYHAGHWMLETFWRT